MSKIDLTNLADLDITAASEKPYEFEVTFDDKPTGIFLSVIGAESEAFQKYITEEGNRARKRAFEAQRKGKGEGFRPVEEDVDTLCRAVAACIVGWRTVKDGKSDPVIAWGEDRLECTRDNAFKVVKRFKFIRDQVNENTGELKNFIPG